PVVAAQNFCAAAAAASCYKQQQAARPPESKGPEESGPDPDTLRRCLQAAQYAFDKGFIEERTLLKYQFYIAGKVFLLADRQVLGGDDHNWDVAQGFIRLHHVDHHETIDTRHHQVGDDQM